MLVGTQSSQNPHTLLVGIKWYNHFGKNSLAGSSKVKHPSPLSLFILMYFLTNLCSYRGFYMSVHSMSVIIINQKQPKCSPSGEWINTLWHSHLMGFDLAIRSELLIYTTVQVNVELIVVCERRQSTYCMKPPKMHIIQPNDTQKIWPRNFFKGLVCKGISARKSTLACP